MTISDNDAIKIWESAQVYANKMRKHYHLTEDETEDLRGEIYAKAIEVTMRKVKSSSASSSSRMDDSSVGLAFHREPTAVGGTTALPRIDPPLSTSTSDLDLVEASASTYGSAVCKYCCYNLGRAIKRRREEAKHFVSIENAFNDEGEITDRALGALEDYGAKKAFKAYLIREGVEVVFERTKKREAEVIAALILSDGFVNEAARELDPSVPKAYGKFLNRVKKSRKAFVKIFFGKGKRSSASSSSRKDDSSPSGRVGTPCTPRARGTRAPTKIKPPLSTSTSTSDLKQAGGFPCK